MNLNPLLHYNCLTEFKTQYLKNVLSHEHLQEGEIHLKKCVFPDGGEDEEFNFWGYEFIRDGERYLVSSSDKNGNKINIKNIIPLLPLKTQKLSSKGNVYNYVTQPKTVRFKSEKKISFKEVVDTITNQNVSNPEHKKLLMFMSLASMLDRANFRVSSPAGFGKDSTVLILDSLLGGCVTIANPTIAKLEYLTYMKWLVVNEVVDISKAEWRKIEQFLLDTGDHRPRTPKHSRAIAQGTTETINLEKFSIGLFYNDIDVYTEPSEYFDFITKGSVLNRFPAFRLHGRYTEDFNEIHKINVEEFVKANFELYKDLIYSLTYYKDNLIKELKHFNAKNLIEGLPNRWLLNIGKLLRIVDLYCENQEEFDYWLDVINKSITDYRAMLKYPTLLKDAEKKLSSKSYTELLVKVKQQQTFIGKNKLLFEGSSDKAILENVDWKDW